MNAEKLWPLSQGVAVVITCLNMGLEGHGHWAVHASKNGLRLTANGVTIARGADSYALEKSFNEFRRRMAGAPLAKGPF